MSATMGAMILAAYSAAVPSTALPIESSPNRRRPAPSPAISENTAPIILMSDFLLGRTCTTRLARLGSRLVRSRTLLVRSLTWCSWGTSRWAGASASASYGTSATLGQKPSIWAVAS